MNYFIDESKLCLEEKNIFTSTELNTLIPVYNAEVYNQLMHDNHFWISRTHPNLGQYKTNGIQVKTAKPLKKLIEAIFNILLPERFNNFLMKLTDRLWRYKWQRKNYPMNDYDIAMKTRWYVSKQHPLNYQKKVLDFNKPRLQY